jgi:cyclopropane-fatty-acyl-phospholipid synthase
MRADDIRPLVHALLGGEPPVTVELWDGSHLGPPPASSPAVVRVRNRRAVRHLVWQPNELGLGRAYVAGDIDVDGDIFAALAVRDLLADADDRVRIGGRSLRRQALRAAVRTGAVGPPPRRPPEEARLTGRRHTRARDAAAIRHHYDVSNDFYRLVLGETMTYSCAYWADEGMTLDDAQRAKYELVCRKLGLVPGMRLLDVGCGWGGMVIHAAREHGVRAVGITLSPAQWELAQKRVAEAGVADRVEVRLQDYRDVNDGPYDAISSIGMFEHVGLERLREYFTRLHALLRPEGRLLNHAISRPRPGPSGFDRHSFIDHYVFPDGELHEVGTVVTAMQELGFEVRDVESLREHYGRTLRAWVANLEANWEAAVAAAGSGRARVWRLYMAASALNFEANRTSVHQVLAVKPGPGGSSGMPPTRHGFVVP